MRNHTAVLSGLIIIALTFCGCDATLSGAAYHGKYELAQELVNKGHEVNAYDKWGWTPLMWAACYNQYSIARLLLEKGADPNKKSVKEYKSLAIGSTPLMVAAYYGNTIIIKEMLKYKADPEIKDTQGNSAITYAEQFHGESALNVFKAKN